MGESNIVDLAVAAWRLERWLDNLKAERKMAAKSALRAIKKYLGENNIEILDLTGLKFDVGLAVSVVNNESEETDEDQLIISEMVKPIIKKDGAVVQYGQVILGESVKKQKENGAVEEAAHSKETAAEKKIVEAAETLQKTEKEAPVAEHEASTVPAQKEKKSLSKPGICMIGLQVAVMVLALLTLVRIGTIEKWQKEQTAEPPAVPPAIEENNNQTDLSGVESQLENIMGKLPEMEQKLDEAQSRLDEVMGKLDELGKEDEKNETEEKKYITYIVQKGDTLYRICRGHDMDPYKAMNEIMKINKLGDADRLTVGQRLLLPMA